MTKYQVVQKSGDTETVIQADLTKERAENLATRCAFADQGGQTYRVEEMPA
jgi:hypothetical protein